MSPSEYDTLVKSLKKLPGEFKSLIEKRIELFTLEVGERISGVMAHAFYRITGVVFLSLGLILILFAASKFVGELLGNEGLGFVVVAAPMLLIGLMFFFRRPRSMVNSTRDKMLSQFMKELTEQISQIERDDDTARAEDTTRKADNRSDHRAEPEDRRRSEEKESRESQKPNTH